MITDVQKKEVKNYVAFLASTLHLDTTKIAEDMSTYEELFVAGGRKKINEVFFSSTEKYAKQQVEQKEAYTNETLTALVRFYAQDEAKRIQEPIRNLEAIIQESIGDIEYYQGEIKKKLENVAKHRNDIYIRQEALKSIEAADFTDSCNGVLKALADIGVSNLRVYGNTLFMNLPEITLAYFNQEAKVNLTVNMGVYEVQVNISTLAIKIVGGKLRCLSYIHPHVGSNGDICFGNASSAYKRAVETRSIPLAVQAAYSVLKEYNDASPYACLSRFYDKAEQDEREAKLVAEGHFFWKQVSGYARWRSDMSEELPVSVNKLDITGSGSEWDGEDCDWVEFRYYRAYKNSAHTDPMYEDDGSTCVLGVKAGNNRIVRLSAELAEELEIS